MIVAHIWCKVVKSLVQKNIFGYARSDVCVLRSTKLEKIIRYCNYYHIIINYPMIDLMLSRDLFLILTRVNEIKKNALKRVHSHQSLSTHYWLAGIWHQISIVLIHYVKSVIRIYICTYYNIPSKCWCFLLFLRSAIVSASERERESIEKNCCPFCFF